MINRKDVIRMKVPFPDINAGLAVSSHMYICRMSGSSCYEFVKCQTLKPHMIGGSLVKHYIDEKPDINRNPFVRTTRIDCDKTFRTHGVTYDDAMKTTARPDVCDDLMNIVEAELIADGYDANDISEIELKAINSRIN